MLLFTCSLTITTALFDVVYFSSRIFAPDCQKPGLFFCSIYWRKTIVTCPVHLLSNLITTIVGFNVCRWTLIPLLCLRVLFNCSTVDQISAGLCHFRALCWATLWSLTLSSFSSFSSLSGYWHLQQQQQPTALPRCTFISNSVCVRVCVFALD